METADELKKWVESLSIAEKRFITLLGKARAGANTSQQLELFDWLNQAAPGDPLPVSARFRQNLPTVSKRLKDLILDGLRILHKEDGTDALLRTTLDEIAILLEKKLYRAAARQLKRAKKLALETSRYDFAIQCLEHEQKAAPVLNPGEVRETLRKLRGEETEVLARLERMRELQFRHSALLALVKQFPFHREDKILQEVRELAESELVKEQCNSKAYIEQALAVNILGISDLFERKPIDALKRYQGLLENWKQHPEWQLDQTELLLTICKFYQTACFFSPVNWEEARAYIAMLSGFKGLSTDAARDFQRMLYHNQFTLALNTGKFDSVQKMIPEIDEWLRKESEKLSEAQTLPFLCNFAIAEFLLGNNSAANKIVMRILNTPNRKIRIDIREFALVLQAVLQYESGNENLHDYLLRAGKRHFQKITAEVNFELTVMKHLEAMARAATASAQKTATEALIAELNTLAEQVQSSIPLLGLNEISMWAQSKSSGIPVREIFFGEIRKNLESMGQLELLEN